MAITTETTAVSGVSDKREERGRKIEREGAGVGFVKRAAS